MDRIGKYQIIGQIGQGAMGVVYKAMDPFIERVVAVKTMSADLDADPEVRARFFREARSAGQLSHKNIVTIFDLGEEGGKAYMAMEFLDGEDLKHIIARRDKLPLERKLQLMKDILEGLSHAHNRQVIHRDIKPGNIHITRSGQVKILDFGLARVSSSDITKTGSVMGTPNYMSPEQIRSEGVDHRSDLFSAGATFYELLSYRKPFYSSSLPATFFKILQQDPEPLESIDPAIPPEFSAIVLRAMAKDPEKRYQSVDEMLRDLERLEKSLQEKRQLVIEEAKEAVNRLDRLVLDHMELLEDEAAKLHRTDLSKLFGSVPAGDPDNSNATLPVQPHLGYSEVLEFRNHARREFERLQDLLGRRKQAAVLLKDAERLEQEGDLESALIAAEQITGAVPDHAAAHALKHRVRDALLARVEGEARDAMAELDRLVSENRFLEGQVENFQGDQTLPMIESALSGEDADATLQLPAEYVQMLRVRDGARREQKRLLEMVDKRRQALCRLEEAEDLERRGLLEAAMERLEASAAELPDLPEAQQALGRIHEALRQAERRREAERNAGRLVSGAQARYDAGDLSGARKALEEALTILPDHQDAAAFLDRVRRSKAEREEAARRARIARETVERARQAWTSGDPGLARQLLAEAVAQDAAVDGAARLASEIDRAEAELKARREREEAVRAGLAGVRNAIASSDDAGAARQLEAVLALDPGNAESAALRTKIEQMRAAREREQAEKRRRIGEGLERARQACARGELEPAIEALQAVLSEEPGHHEAAALMAKCRKDLEARRKREELERRAAALIAQANNAAEGGDPAAAVRLLQGSESGIRALPAVQEALARFAARLKALEEERKRAEQVQRHQVLADQSFQKGEYEACEQELGRILALEPANARATELLRQTRKLLEQKREEERRRREISQSLARASQALAAGRFESVPLELSRVLELEPGNQEARRLRAESDRRQAELRRQKERRERAEELAREAARRLNAGDAPEALKLLDEAVGLWPELEGAARLRKKIARRKPAAARAAGARRRTLPYVAAAGAVSLGLVAFLYFGTGDASPPASGGSRIQTSAVPAGAGNGQAPGPAPAVVQPREPAVTAPERGDGGRLAEQARAEEQARQEQQARTARLVADANGRAQRLYDAGRFDEAMKAVGEALSLAPGDRDARQMFARLQKYARQAADDGRAKADAARSGAQKANAASLAADQFNRGAAAEQEAMRLYRSGDYGKAAPHFFDAVSAFTSAESQALETARRQEQQRLAALQRSQAEEARTGYQQALSKANEAGASSRAAEPFRQAAAAAGQAEQKWNGGDWTGAREAYESAARGMAAAAEAAAVADQREWNGLRQSRDVAALQAFARRFPKSPLAQQAELRIEQIEWEGVNRKDRESLQAFLQKYRDGPRAREASDELKKLEEGERAAREREGVRQALARYENAFETRNVAALRQAWPDISRAQLEAIQNSFKVSRSIKLELRPEGEPEIAGDSATVVCQRMMVQSFDQSREDLQNKDRITVRLRRSGGNWVIDSIQ